MNTNYDMMGIVCLFRRWGKFAIACCYALRDLLSDPIISLHVPVSLEWRHNERDGVSNHQPHDCLLNRLFSRRSKKISKLRVTGLCAGNSPVTDEFPAQMASNAENVSIWWRHHGQPPCWSWSGTLLKSMVGKGYSSCQQWMPSSHSRNGAWCLKHHSDLI